MDKSKVSLDFIAVAISIFALCIGALNYYSTQDHNEKSVRPKLSFSYKFSIDKNHSGFLKLRNYGDGVATIIGVKAFYNNKEIETDEYSLWKISSDFGLRFLSGSLVKGQVVAARDEVVIYSIPAEKIQFERVCGSDKLRKAFFENIDFEVSYISIYDYVQKVKFDYTSSNKVVCEND